MFDQQSRFRRAVNWIVLHRVKVLLLGCFLVSLFHAAYFWRLGIYPVTISALCVAAMYIFLIWIRRRFDEPALIASCVSIVVFASTAIIFLGNSTGLELYIFGVVAALFILIPGSGNWRYVYQLGAFVALAGAHGLANTPSLSLARRMQAMFLNQSHSAWYVNFTIAFITVIGVSFFFAQSEERSLAELEGIARTDELTGLFNRHHTVPLLKQLEGEYSLAILDIDDFKLVNDSFGHDVGDEVLRAVADTITACVRAGDEVARWGGEEFLVVLPGCPLSAAERVLEVVRTSVAALRIEGHPQIRVTISAGVTDRRERGWESVVQEADRLLYHGKNHGKNVVASSLSLSHSELA